MNFDFSAPYGLQTFDISEDGSHVNKTTHRGDHHHKEAGDYCCADDAMQYILLLLAYRDGHKVGSQECYADDAGDFRCDICKEVDRLCGDDQMVGKLDKMLSQLRSVNNGL